MPPISTTVSTPIEPTFRTSQLAGLFDLTVDACCEQTFSVEVPARDEGWSIGAIVGPSGSGKSTIARAAFGDAFVEPQPWPAHQAVIDGFPEVSIQQITHTLTAVGFSSPPAWLRPYHVLSNGERFRCDLARALLSANALIVCDEFTSVVDRTVAKIGSAAVAKAIRSGRLARQFVAVTCHYDVVPWLAADWVLDMATGRFARGCLQRPPIELRVVRTPQRTWERFARHHYLSGSLSRGATCYLATWNHEPVAFCAVIGMLGHAGHKRITRLVTLPDYQGIGIGTKLLEFVCERITTKGERASITTSHPGMCRYLQASARWRLTRVRRSFQQRAQVVRQLAVRDSQGRAVASFEYLPPSVREIKHGCELQP